LIRVKGAFGMLNVAERSFILVILIVRDDKHTFFVAHSTIRGVRTYWMYVCRRTRQ
jgi:hypothetical protein